ncbi:MAG: sulfatase [Planctomycetaceae bacterium]|nr:sulfatase [Planctomycetales bacterium]MCB9875591.1 sulfatase [Planctomycetaceae bacterium]MCB9941684.1 sulfatase [Planctomycetaceae bacterium]
MRCFSRVPCLALLAFLTCVLTHTANAKPYNLLVIMTDEHNFRTLGCYRELLPESQALMWGKAVVETPNIDWIAKNGAICTSFYATTPVCSSSRAALVSGQYPQNTAVVVNDVPMNDDVVTFAEILAREGYATGYAGKWHLDGTGKPQWAPERKFGFQDNRYMFNRGHWKQLEETPEGPRVAGRDKQGNPSYAIEGATEKNFTTDFLCDKTVEFIESNKDKPFCYMVSIPDPHGPDTVRAPYDTMYDEQTYTQPPSAKKPEEGLPSWGQKQQGGFNMSKYYGMVRCIDDNVGKIIKSLRTNDLLDNTIIVFTSDHGDLRGEHHRQNKGVPYEASTRVPFLVHFPGKVKPGTVINEALTSVDFLPTVLPMMGHKTVGREEGRNASELFANGKAPANWTDIAFVRGTGQQQGWLSVVTDRYKLVYSPVDPPWLFDLERDPDEVTNFFEHAGYREIVQDLATQLRDYAAKNNDIFAELPRINADITWSISGTGAYEAPLVLPDTSKKQRKRAS